MSSTKVLNQFNYFEHEYLRGTGAQQVTAGLQTRRRATGSASRVPNQSVRALGIAVNTPAVVGVAMDLNCEACVKILAATRPRSYNLGIKQKRSARHRDGKSRRRRRAGVRN
jgi:hypothetical protein